MFSGFVSMAFTGSSHPWHLYTALVLKEMLSLTKAKKKYGLTPGTKIHAQNAIPIHSKFILVAQGRDTKIHLKILHPQKCMLLPRY